MAARFEWRGVDRRSLPDLRIDEIRDLLLVAIAEQYAEFERHEARLAADWPDDATGLLRATAALEMFCAREAIEAIADALDRVDGCPPPGLSFRSRLC